MRHYSKKCFRNVYKRCEETGVHTNFAHKTTLEVSLLDADLPHIQRSNQYFLSYICYKGKIIKMRTKVNTSSKARSLTLNKLHPYALQNHSCACRDFQILKRAPLHKHYSYIHKKHVFSSCKNACSV